MDNSAAENGQAPKRKWKKKKSLLAEAKKYAKKEQWGRGANIPEDMYHYLVGILEVMKNGFETDEEKRNFVNNVLERTAKEEVTISSNQLGCRIIEELVPLSSPEDLERFIVAFSDDVRTHSTDRFASFVLERLLSVCCERACHKLRSSKDPEAEPPAKKRKKEKETSEASSEIKYSDEHAETCFNFTIKISKYLLNNLEDFVWDPAANRLLRTSIKCLGGVVSAPCDQPKQPLIKQKTSEENDNKAVKKRVVELKYAEVPTEFKAIVEEYANRLSRWPQFVDMPYETATSGLLQILIYAIGNVNKKITKTIAKKLLDESFAPDSWTTNSNDDKKDAKIDLENEETQETIEKDKSLNLPPVFESEPAVRLLEAVLYVARSKIYTQIYAKCFINRLAVLSTMPGLNYTVQRLFDNCTEKEEFEPMFDEIHEKFDKILVCGNTGVLAAISKACLRLQSKQVKFIQALQTALGCTDPANLRYFVIASTRLLPLTRIDLQKTEEPYFVNIHGSLVVQTMLAFQRPKVVIDSLLAMSQKELLTLFSDAKGCHVADAFFNGSCVGAKSKEVLIRRMKGTLQELAVAKYGSRSLEKMFEGSVLEQKIKIMEEVASKSQLLQSTMFGQLISTNLKVDLYKKSFQNWKTSVEKVEKTKEKFKDIIK